MIQQTNSRHTSAAASSTRQDGPEVWGQWSGRKHYSLEVVQHPLRARMCGFGDKDRRPLAPAAVAKMIVRRDDDSIVDVDDVDCSFFLVTVDLWSADGKHEMNLVLHPSSADRYAPPHSSSKTRRRGASISAPTPRPTGSQTPAGRNSPAPPYRPGEQTPGGTSTPSLSAHAPYASQGYFAPHAPPISDNLSYPQGTPYGPPPPDPTSAWAYPPQPVDRSTNFPPPILPSIHSFGRTSSTSSAEPWQPEPEPEILPYRAWNTDTAYAPVDTYSNQQVDPALRTPSNPDSRENPGWSQSNSYGAPPQSSEVEQNAYGPAPYHQPHQPAYAQYPQPVPGTPPPSHTPSVMPPLPRHTYTRTLVGPLSANACRLLDEHRKPGIFFLFQDLSVRTEGTFRLRMRLMNVGAPPAPEMGAVRVHTDVSPVLAQTFTEQFTVFSAKRFPGVPDTTALSIAFGNQGQKLPLV
ncbi:velvet factor [Crassisporium funariophilum]|nr:velvet factor [Crassisporium funariophilum]